MEEQLIIEESIADDNDLIRAKVEINYKILFQYMMQNSYISIAGKLNWFLHFFIFLIFLISLQYEDIAASVLLLGIVLMQFVFRPLLYLRNSKKQIEENEIFRHPMIYSVNEEGLAIEQYSGKGTIAWKDLFQVIETKKFLLFYKCKGQAFILPKSQIGDFLTHFRSVIRSKKEVRYRLMK